VRLTSRGASPAHVAGGSLTGNDSSPNSVSRASVRAGDAIRSLACSESQPAAVSSTCPLGDSDSSSLTLPTATLSVSTFVSYCQGLYADQGSSVGANSVIEASTALQGVRTPERADHAFWVDPGRTSRSNAWMGFSAPTCVLKGE